MKKKYLLLPALLLLAAGCVQKKQADLTSPLQQLTNAVSQLNSTMTTLDERVATLEKGAMQSASSTSEMRETKTITDEKSFISLAVPNAWQVKNLNVQGSLLSGLTAESVNFASHEDLSNCEEGCLCTPVRYDQGASLSIHIYDRALWGDGPVGYHGFEGGATNVGVTQTKNISVDGKSALYYVFDGFCGGDPGQRYVHIEYNGTVYEITLNSSPTTYPEAEIVFDEILQTIRFLG